MKAGFELVFLHYLAISGGNLLLCKERKSPEGERKSFLVTASKRRFS